MFSSDFHNFSFLYVTRDGINTISRRWEWIAATKVRHFLQHSKNQEISFVFQSSVFDFGISFGFKWNDGFFIELIITITPLRCHYTVVLTTKHRYAMKSVWSTNEEEYKAWRCPKPLKNNYFYLLTNLWFDRISWILNECLSWEKKP